MVEDNYIEEHKERYEKAMRELAKIKGDDISDTKTQRGYNKINYSSSQFAGNNNKTNEIKRLLREKAKDFNKAVELEIEKLEKRATDKQREASIKKRKESKNKAQILYEQDKKRRQAERDQIEYEKTSEGQLAQAERERLENLERDIAMGLTEEDIILKYMDEREHFKYINMKNSGQCTDVKDYLKQKKIMEEKMKNTH